MLADHIRHSHVAQRLALSRNHVHYCVRRYLTAAASRALRDAPRPGRKDRLGPEIQALDRTRPALPPRPFIPERHTHDDIRHGTTCFCAALRLLDGRVLCTCRPKRDATGFIKFLDHVDQATPTEERDPRDLGQFEHA